MYASQRPLGQLPNHSCDMPSYPKTVFVPGNGRSVVLKSRPHTNRRAAICTFSPNPNSCTPPLNLEGWCRRSDLSVQSKLHLLRLSSLRFQSPLSVFLFDLCLLSGMALLLSQQLPDMSSMRRFQTSIRESLAALPAPCNFPRNRPVTNVYNPIRHPVATLIVV